MASLRRHYAKLRLRVNKTKGAVAPVWERKFLGYSFWKREGEAKLRVADQAVARLKDRVRTTTRPTVGRSLKQVAEELRRYLLGWKGYFRLAETPRVFLTLDKWIRHRLRALQLKQWRRGRTIHRELVARGLSAHKAAKVASQGRRWYRIRAKTFTSRCPSPISMHLAFPIFPHNLNLSNRRMRTRTSGGVGGEPLDNSCGPLSRSAKRSTGRRGSRWRAKSSHEFIAGTRSHEARACSVRAFSSLRFPRK